MDEIDQSAYEAFKQLHKARTLAERTSEAYRQGLLDELLIDLLGGDDDPQNDYPTGSGPTQATGSCMPKAFIKTQEGWTTLPYSEAVPTGRAEVEIHDEQIDLTEEQRKKIHDFVKDLCKAN